jgi:hypothetical protein
VAGEDEAAAVLRCEPAEPVRDADLCGCGLFRAGAVAIRCGRVLSWAAARELGGRPLPYAWAPEWHPGGHGLHVHFAVGRYVKQRLIADVWGRGIAHIKLIGDLPVGSGALEEARRGRLPGQVREQEHRRCAGAAPASLRGRAGLPAGEGRAAIRLGGGGGRCGVAAHGSAAGAGLALGRAGGLASVAGVLVCLGWMTNSANEPQPGPSRPPWRRGCRHGSRT